MVFNLKQIRKLNGEILDEKNYSKESHYIAIIISHLIGHLEIIESKLLAIEKELNKRK